MTHQPPGRGLQLAVRAVPIAVAIPAFLAAQPWLRQQAPVVFQAVVVAFVIVMLGYAAWVARWYQRHLDEVELASQRVAVQQGWNGGTIAAVLLLMLPPVMNGLVDLAISSGGTSAGVPTRGAVQLAFFWGLMLAVVVQTAGIFIAGLLWWRRMGGLPERS